MTTFITIVLIIFAFIMGLCLGALYILETSTKNAINGWIETTKSNQRILDQWKETIDVLRLCETENEELKIKKK